MTSHSVSAAIARNIRTSPSKMRLVADLIRRMPVDKALIQLDFSKKRIAQDVKKCLQSAIANAENNHNMNIDNLVVGEIFVDKALVMKRMRPRARGRSGKIQKFFSNLTIRLIEVDRV